LNYANLSYVNLYAAQYIKNSAFSSCTSLAKCNCPELKTIGDYAFAYDRSIEDFYAPKLSSIFTRAFYGAKFAIGSSRTHNPF
jgi:hypothetical protein